MKAGDVICSCGHTKEAHRSEAIGDITYCRKCGCDHFYAEYEVVPVHKDVSK